MTCEECDPLPCTGRIHPIVAERPRRDNRGMTSPPLGVDAVHERLAGDLLAVGAPYGLVLAGGEAVRAHGLVEAG